LAAGAARCQRCGAPLELTPETIVAVCEYCGFPNWTSQAYIHPIELVPARSSEARYFFQKYLETDPDMKSLRGRVELRGTDTIYVPLYIAEVEATARYSGVATVTLTRTKIVKTSKGTEVRTETRYVTVSVSGVVDRDFELPLVARRVVDKTMVEPLVSYYMKTRPESTPIQNVEWDEVKGTVLASEVTPQDAQVWARDEACDQLQEEVEKLMEKEARAKAAAMSPGWIPGLVVWSSKRIPCKAVNRRLSPILLVPMIIAYYSYAKSLYKVMFSGWDGAKLYAEEPLTPGQRALYAGGMMISSGLLGGAGAAILAGAGEAVVGGLLLLAGLAASYYLGSRAVADVRVEKEV